MYLNSIDGGISKSKFFCRTAIIKNGDFSALGWTGEYDEASSAIEAAQAIRGFHTLEFLIFKDGKARTVKD